MRKNLGITWGTIVAPLLISGLFIATPVWAGPGTGADPEMPVQRGADPRDGVRKQDVPDIFGPGHVSTVGNVWVKTTNIGVIGNPFTAQSSDPSGQWPGASGVEYLFFAGVWVAAKDPSVSDPGILRRVSHNTEWRPPTLGPEDRIYRSFDGQVSGARFVDDDGDGLIDEDRLDGHDNDGDGKIDEDYAAISQQMFTCILRDDTPQALEAAFNEKHVQRNLEIQQNTYAFSVPGANDFTSFEFIVENVGTSTLDSVFIAFQIDGDVGPVIRDNFFSDDLAEPRFPQGPDLSIDMLPNDPDNPNRLFLENVAINDPRFQFGLCTLDTVFVHGYSFIDDDGDMGEAPGASSIILLGHTIDPTGQKAPRRVGMRMYTFFTPGTPFPQGGFPTNDLERYEIASSNRGIDPVTGFIDAEPPNPGDAMDYFSLFSVGPFLNFRPGEKIFVAWALGVQEVDYSKPINDIRGRYIRNIKNAVEAVKTFRGTYETRVALPSPSAIDGFGQETALIANPGEEFLFSDCHDDSSGSPRTVKDNEFTWFDADCNYCTGVAGKVLKRWVASAPPPSPQMTTVPGDRRITIKWDNRSEYTPDPAKGFFDFKGYKIWKAANWTRPVGSTGPSDDLWALLATYFFYGDLDPLIETVFDPVTGDSIGTFETSNVLLNRLTGHKIFPGDVPCLMAGGACDTVFADKPTVAVNGSDSTAVAYPVIKYPIGRYELADSNVINGFIYFYSVTAFDSTGKGSGVAKLEGRQAAVAGEQVIPQASVNLALNDGKVFVVPNPYRGRAEWDLTPDAADPTGTHVDFFNMPLGAWTLKIYTVSGDLVQILHANDIQVNGKPQQETPEDSEATWNLVSRNGQEIVSGIYLFSVQGDGGTQQGKFVVIR